MKKVLILSLMFFSVSFMQAQDTLLTTKSSKGVPYHAVELDGLFNFNSGRFGGGVGIHEIYGKQFNPHLVLGGGLSFDYLDFKGVDHFANHYEEFDIDEFVFRLYVNFRYIVLAKTRWSPMLMLSAGAIGLLDIPQSYRGCEPVKLSSEFGFFASLFMGVHYKLTNRHGFYGGISYGMDVPLLTGFTFKIGFSF